MQRTAQPRSKRRRWQIPPRILAEARREAMSISGAAETDALAHATSSLEQARSEASGDAEAVSSEAATAMKAIGESAESRRTEAIEHVLDVIRGA